MRKFIFFCFLALTSLPSFADSYPAVVTRPDGLTACHYWRGITSTFDSNTGACIGGPLAVNDPAPYYPPYYPIPTCPAGGTIDNNNCVNAPACSSNMARNPVTAICEPAPNCKLAETYDSSTNTCIAPSCTSPQINDAITGACITPTPNCKIAEFLNPVTNTCVAPTCTSPQINDAITGACITPTPSISPDCSTVLCTSVDQSCTDSDGVVTVKPACPLPPTNDPPPNDGSSGGGSTGGGSSGGGSSGGGSTGGGSTGGGSTGGDTTAGGTNCPAYYHPDGFGGCSNGDCPPGQFRDTVVGSACQMIPTALDTTDLAKDASVQALKSSVDSAKSSIDASINSINAVKNSVNASKSSIDSVKASTDAVKTSVDAVKTSVDANKTVLDAIKSSTDASKNALNEVNFSVQNVKSSIDSLSSQFQSLTDGVATPVSPSPGTNDFFDDSIPDNQAADLKERYHARFILMQSSLSDLFVLSSGGVGQLPVIDFGYIKGAHVVVDLNRYSVSLSYVGLTLIFVATFVAIMIFLG